jgi:tetratricopeptide (TPR) repeat protein
VAHAHARGLLHRDLKPANILVDAEGHPYVTDFGLAKKVVADVELTQSGAILGTPAYMSPEQASGHRGAVTTASDTYGLGAVLYTLLTGKAPFGGDSVVEALDAVRHAPPQPPRRLNAAVPRDLETICLKCLEKEPRRRYPTAQALADDLRAWLDSRPIAARRVGAAERARLWCRRKPAVAALAAAVALAIVGGTAAVIAVQAKANADLRAANARERQRFDLAMEAVKLFHGEVSEDLLLRQKEFAGLRSRLLKGAADFYGKLERLLAVQSDPSSRTALGRAYHDLAELTGEIGNVPEALDVYRKALDVRRELAGRPGSDDAAMLDLVRSLYALGSFQMLWTRDAAGSRKSWEEALRLAEGLVAAGRGGDEARFELARCAERLSHYIAEGRPDEGLAMAHRAETILRELVAKAPSETRYLEALGVCLQGKGARLGGLGRQSEVLAVWEEAAATFQKLVDARPEVYRIRNGLAVQHQNLAGKYLALGQLDAAIASLRRAVAIWREAARANPAVTLKALNLAGHGLNFLAGVLIDGGRPVEALVSLAEARPILKKLVDANLGTFSQRSHLAMNEILTSNALTRMGMSREADDAIAEAGATLRKLAEEHPKSLADQATLFREFGWGLWKERQPAEAAAVFEQERAIWQRMAAAGGTEGANPNALANCETNAAAALVASGRPAEARAACDRAIAFREGRFQEHPAYASFTQGLAESLLRSGHARAAAGDLAGAAADWRRAAALYAAHPPGGEPAILRACCHGALAELAGQSGGGVSPAETRSQADEAMAVLRRAIDEGYRDFGLIRVEPGLDPLRSRDDFRRLMSDLTFPADPFAYRVDAEYRPVPAPLITPAPAGEWWYGDAEGAAATATPTATRRLWLRFAAATTSGS